MTLCKYKDIFGTPNTGAHSIRLFGIAFIDLLMTILVAYIISILIDASFIYMLILLFVLSIIAHRMFCVKTNVDKFIFGE